MTQLRLSPRLQAVANWIGTCDTLADVGTDHGFLPAYLVLSGCCRRAFACDVNEGPLRRAANTVRAWGCADRVVLIRSDGLKNVPREYDVLVMAGMGGDLIASLLDACPPPESARLFLQPMTKADTLRRRLYETGYTVCSERAVREGDRVYGILSVIRQPDLTDSGNDFDLPRRLERSDDAVFYLQSRLRAHEKRLRGLEHSASPDPERIAAERRIISLLERYFEEESHG